MLHLHLIVVCLLLLICHVSQGETGDILQRLDYGVVSKKADMYIAREDWLHTFQIQDPKRVNIPNIGT